MYRSHTRSKKGLSEFSTMLKTREYMAMETIRLSMGAIGRRRVDGALSWDQTKTDLLLAYEMHFAGRHQVLEIKLYEDGNYHTDVQRNC